MWAKNIRFQHVCIIPIFASFVAMISPKGPEIEVISRQIANAHTTFNIVCTLIWLPLIPCRVTDCFEEIITRTRTLIKDRKDFSDVAKGELDQCFAISEHMFLQTMDAVCTGDAQIAAQMTQGRKQMHQAQKTFNKAHLARVKEKTCDASLTQDFTDILYNFDRVVDNCVAVAEEVMGGIHLVTLEDTGVREALQQEKN